MDLDAIFLSRLQFAFTVSFHVIFPAFTVGLAAWLATLQGLYVFTGREVFDRLFAFWIKIFAVAFGMGVVSGIVMAFQFGTNWSVLSARSGPIMGPLLAYEAFSAFLLEATFLGVLLFGREKLPKWLYFAAALCVAMGTTVSSYWILVNNSWMHYPVGLVETGQFYAPDNWREILFSEAVLARFPHMLLGAYITTALCVAATGAWYLLRNRAIAESKWMMGMGLGLVAILIPFQIYAGHAAGKFIREHQPEKYAAFEGRWETGSCAPLIAAAAMDREARQNSWQVDVPVPCLGSLVGTGSADGVEHGLSEFADEELPPLHLPFYSFRIMVGLGILMVLLSWGGMVLLAMGRLWTTRWFKVATFLSFPSGFIAILTGWVASEVGRQPWTIQYLLTTEASISPIGPVEVLISLITFGVVYTLIFASGTFYIYRLLRSGLDEGIHGPPKGATANRPLALPGDTSMAP